MGDTELKQDHKITEACPNFSVDGGRSVAEVKDFIQRLDPTQVDKAGAAYIAVSKKLNTSNDAIHTAAVDLSKVWDGEVSVKAQEALRTLHATIRELAAKADKFGVPLQSLAPRLQEHKDFVSDTFLSWSDNDNMFGTMNDSVTDLYRTMDKGWEWGSQNGLAGEHLKLLNDDLLKVYQQFPQTVHKELPDIKPPGGDDTTYKPPGWDPTNFNGKNFNPDGSQFKPAGLNLDDNKVPGFDPATANGDYGADGGGNGFDPKTGGYGNGFDPKTGGYGNDPNGANGFNPNGANGNGGTDGAFNPDTSGMKDPGTRTSLADFQRPAGWDPSAATHTGTSPYSSNGFNAGNSTGTGTGVGGGGLMAPGGLPANARSGSVSGTGMPMMPMGGMGGANESEESENSTWLHEDDDVWGTDTDGAVSNKIG